METNPHDRFARRAFADLDVMRAHLRGFLPPEIVTRLDLSRLRREPDTLLDPELREGISDFLFSVPRTDGGDALVWFVFEHKSTPDRWLPYDLLRSAVRVTESWRREDPTAEGFPWVIPVVLYAGPRAFAAPRRYAELCGALKSTDDGPVLGPDLRYVLTDLSRFTDDQLRARAGQVAFAAVAHLLLKNAWAPDLRERFERWADLLVDVVRQPTGLTAIRSVLSFLLGIEGEVTEHDFARVVLPRLDVREQETVMTTMRTRADELRAEGRQREAAKNLLKLLRRRFDVSDALAARVDAAPLEELDRWFDRALDADALDDVFAD